METYSWEALVINLTLSLRFHEAHRQSFHSSTVRKGRTVHGFKLKVGSCSLVARKKQLSHGMMLAWRPPPPPRFLWGASKSLREDALIPFPVSSSEREWDDSHSKPSSQGSSKPESGEREGLSAKSERDRHLEKENLGSHQISGPENFQKFVSKLLMYE